MATGAQLRPMCHVCDHVHRYFGAARDLPGVRELFAAAEEPKTERKTKGDLMKAVDPGAPRPASLCALTQGRLLRLP